MGMAFPGMPGMPAEFAKPPPEVIKMMMEEALREMEETGGEFDEDNVPPPPPAFMEMFGMGGGCRAAQVEWGSTWKT